MFTPVLKKLANYFYASYEASISKDVTIPDGFNLPHDFDVKARKKSFGFISLKNKIDGTTEDIPIDLLEDVLLKDVIDALSHTKRSFLRNWKYGEGSKDEFDAQMKQWDELINSQEELIDKDGDTNG